MVISKLWSREGKYNIGRTKEIIFSLNLGFQMWVYTCVHTHTIYFTTRKNIFLKFH